MQALLPYTVCVLRRPHLLIDVCAGKCQKEVESEPPEIKTQPPFGSCLHTHQ